MSRIAGILALVLALSGLLGAGSAQALTLEPVGGGFDQPIYVTSDPGDAGRLLVVERAGTIRQVEDGVVSQFADLSAEVGCCVGEGGLLSIALPDDFDLSGRLYVYYTGREETPAEIHVAELQGFGAGPLRNLLTIKHPDHTNHYGGQLQFGPEGDLFIATGDGGGQNDEPQHSAQNLGSLLGKILRIDPSQSGANPYGIPTGNPFAGKAAPPFDTIWSYGLRNPYRFSFDSLTGDMTIGDVGQDAREEIDLAPAPGLGAGADYGWNCREGLLPGPATDPQCATPPAAGFVPPAFEYSHGPDPDLGGGRCAVTGGYVVRDPGLGGLYGSYLYADYCAGVLRALQLPAAGDGRAYGDCSLGLRASKPVSFGEDAAGRVYVVEQAGRVLRLVGPPPATCPAPAAPAQSPPQARQAPTFIRLKAGRRRVERGKAALLTVFVSPCEGRRGESVQLLRNGRANGSRYLSRACTAHFLPRIRRGTRFVAVTRDQRGYLPGKSRGLTIRLARHRRHG